MDELRKAVDEAKEELLAAQASRKETGEALRAMQKGLEATQQGLEATQKGLEVTQKGLEATQKGLEATQKGLEATDRRFDNFVARYNEVTEMLVIHDTDQLRRVTAVEGELGEVKKRVDALEKKAG